MGGWSHGASVIVLTAAAGAVAAVPQRDPVGGREDDCVGVRMRSEARRGAEGGGSGGVLQRRRLSQRIFSQARSHITLLIFTPWILFTTRECVLIPVFTPSSFPSLLGID